MVTTTVPSSLTLHAEPDPSRGQLRIAFVIITKLKLCLVRDVQRDSWDSCKLLILQIKKFTAVDLRGNFMMIFLPGGSVDPCLLIWSPAFLHFTPGVNKCSFKNLDFDISIREAAHLQMSSDFSYFYRKSCSRSSGNDATLKLKEIKNRTNEWITDDFS